MRACFIKNQSILYLSLCLWLAVNHRWVTCVLYQESLDFSCLSLSFLLLLVFGVDPSR